VYAEGTKGWKKGTVVCRGTKFVGRKAYVYAEGLSWFLCIGVCRGKKRVRKKAQGYVLGKEWWWGERHSGMQRRMKASKETLRDIQMRNGRGANGAWRQTRVACRKGRG
jgi:hypothetical protein